MLAEYQRIDREYPGPPIPPLDDLHEVEQIDSDGTIHLWNGDALVLAGLAVIIFWPRLRARLA